MPISLFGNKSQYDPSCARYDINGQHKPTGVQNCSFEMGASAEYYYAHGEQGPSGATRTKYEPTGEIELLTGDADALDNYLFYSGEGASLKGASSEVKTTFTIRLDPNDGGITMEFVLYECRFLSQGFAVGQSGSLTPTSMKYKLMFTNGTMNGRPFWQRGNALPI